MSESIEFPPGTTYLGSEPSAEDLARRDRFRRKIDKLSAVSDCWIDGYLAGEVSFYAMCRNVGIAARHAGISERAQETWIGRAARLGLAQPPAGKGRDNAYPTQFKQVASELFESVASR